MKRSLAKRLPVLLLGLALPGVVAATTLCDGSDVTPPAPPPTAKSGKPPPDKATRDKKDAGPQPQPAPPAAAPSR